MSKPTFPAMEACGNLIRTARAEDGSGGWHVAEVAVTHIEGEASRRARLFAAAPELLEALLDLRGEIVHDEESELSRAEFDAMLTRVEAAISKATEAGR